MKKRNKIMLIIGGLLLAIILMFTLLDGTFLSKKYASVWNDNYINQLENDQSKMIAAGIRSASSHNSQPWLVKTINSDTIELYANMEKALPVVDQDNKQLLMSQGAFIEAYTQSAKTFGYDIEITYNEPNFNEQTPLIATISVSNKSNSDNMDVVTRSTYDSLSLDSISDFETTLNRVISEYPGFSYTIIDSNQDVEKLETVLLEGTTIESKDEAATKELLNVFRFTEWQKNEFRYGLSLNTLPAIITPIIQPIIN